MGLLAFIFIAVHTIDGQLMVINPQQIVTMREARDQDQRVVHGKVRCVVTLSDGKYASTLEPCAEIRKMVESMRGTGQ